MSQRHTPVILAIQEAERIQVQTWDNIVRPVFKKGLKKKNHSDLVSSFT